MLERIIPRLRQHLPEDTSKTGYWQFTLSDPKNPKGSYGGNVLTLEKREVYDGSIDKNGIDLEYLRLCQASMEAGMPLKKVDVRYAHDGNDWRLEVGIETGANYDKLEKARRPLDLKLTAMLHDYGNQHAPGWDRVSFTFEDGAFELFVMVVPKTGETTRETLVAPEAFQAVFADVRALYERFGRIVRYAAWRADPKKVGKPNVTVNAG